ncbi:MAG: hypothetical protein ACK56I_21250, partial [bacterium]
MRAAGSVPPPALPRAPPPRCAQGRQLSAHNHSSELTTSHFGARCSAKASIRNGWKPTQRVGSCVTTPTHSKRCRRHWRADCRGAGP